MCMTYTTSQDEKAILRVLCVYKSIIQVLRPTSAVDCVRFMLIY